MLLRFCWVGQEVHSGFSVTSDGKTGTNFMANLIKWLKAVVLNWCGIFALGVLDMNGGAFSGQMTGDSTGI